MAHGCGSSPAILASEGRDGYPCTKWVTSKTIYTDEVSVWLSDPASIRWKSNVDDTRHQPKASTCTCTFCACVHAHRHVNMYTYTHTPADLIHKSQALLHTLTKQLPRWQVTPTQLQQRPWLLQEQIIFLSSHLPIWGRRGPDLLYVPYKPHCCWGDVLPSLARQG